MTETLGLLTEIYLMMTTCLPTSSLLLQKSKHTFISPAQKILIEILYLQFFTFPLLSWREMKQEVMMILRRLVEYLRLVVESDLSSRLLAVFSILYFIYDNTTLNPDPDAKTICDRTSTVQNDTQLNYRLKLSKAANEIGSSCEILKRSDFYN